MYLTILLQITPAITDSVSNLPTAAATTEQPSLSLIDLLFKGGWVMIPLFILSLITIYIITERYLAIRSASRDPESFMNTVKTQILKGDLPGALLLCQQTHTP